ncbi:hypothetical protein FB45DRAFT_869496 [Roridomyces roridus]|uniref:Uncharacterized protein n=1 Tax=Roridomyces roridus TaxID=1738132 RepID=A0AAD7FC96_9AGAR|nr:hypothetical protein FB45DRAFT_1037962 [Roridomyces roridus]KAJ7624585.1 hypothetical protein FB45DRAFT_869496 [Roridomyces roridus]
MSNIDKTMDTPPVDTPVDTPYQAPQRRRVTTDDTEGSRAKRTVIGGPGRNAFDEVRENEKFYKEQHRDARAKNRAAAQDNENLRVLLTQAEIVIKDRQEEVHRLQVQIAECQAQMERMDYDETGLHAQIQHDQERLSNLLQQVNNAQRQAAEASAQAYQVQQAMQARDIELHQLRAQVHKQDDEVNHLRLQIQAAARAKAKATPIRRRGRVTNELFGKDPSAQLLPTLALNPAPLPAESPAEPAVVPVNPLVERFAAKMEMDVVGLTELMGVLKLALQDDNVQVAVNTKARPRKSSAKADMKKACAPETKELVLHTHSLLRRVTFEKFKVELGSDFIFHSPATERQVEDFAEAENATLSHWQWDFNTGYLDSAWNAVQMERLINAAIKEDEKGMQYIRKGEIHREFLEFVLSEQLERYRGDWKLFQPRWLPDKDRAETKAEAVARGKVMVFMRRMNSKSINAQRRKFLVRRNTTEAVIAMKETEGASDLATWNRILELLDHLQSDGMSEEEEIPKTISGQKVKAFQILLCVWREPDIAKIMRLVDMQKQRFEDIHNGTKSAVRERSKDTGNRAAPKGLPRCLYDSNWFNSLSPKQVKELKVSKEVFALFVAATERMAM